MNVTKKFAAAAIAAGIVIAPLTVLSEGAHAATVSCASASKAAGTAKARKKASAHYAKVEAAKLAKAQKAEKAHPSAANKKKVAAAKKAHAKAVKVAHAKANHFNTANKTAVQACKKTSGTGTTVPASTLADQVDTSLTSLGVPATAADPIAQTVGTVLGGKLDASQADAVVQQLSPVLDALNSAGIPISTATVESALGALTNSGTSGAALSEALSQVTDQLAAAGLPTDQIGSAIQSGLEQLATQTGLTPDGIVPDLITGVDSVLTGLTGDTGVDVASLESTLNTLTPSLTSTISSLTGSGDALSGLAGIIDPTATGLGL